MTIETTNTPVWSNEDSAAAAEQGWAIFTTSRDVASEKELVNGKPYGHRPFELQRDDEMGVFEDDAAAHVFVRDAAAKGDGLAQRALAYLQVVSPLEYEAIIAG